MGCGDEGGWPWLILRDEDGYCEDCDTDSVKKLIASALDELAVEPQ